MALLKAQDIRFSYPDHEALKGISFELKKQTITALIGPNGAGKTTLLRCLAALHAPLSGSIQFDGSDIQEFPRLAHRKLGYLADDFGLYKDLTVEQCLEHAAGIQLLTGSANEKAVKNTITRLELTKYADTKTKNLSRGWRQRVGIGTAIVHNPQLLLLDEPASGLDPEARQHLSVLMCKLKDEGMTLLVSSHILAELESYCEEMLILKDGKLVSKSAKSEKPKILITLSEKARQFADILKAEKKLSNLKIKANNIIFSWNGDQKSQNALLKRLMKKGLPITSFAEATESMQDLYFASIGEKS